MPMHKPHVALIAHRADGVPVAPSYGQQMARYGIGHPATTDEIKGWNIDIGRDGSGLPPGHGGVAQDASCSPTSAPPATAPTAKAASATNWSAARAPLRRRSR